MSAGCHLEEWIIRRKLSFYPLWITKTSFSINTLDFKFVLFFLNSLIFHRSASAKYAYNTCSGKVSFFLVWIFHMLIIHKYLFVVELLLVSSGAICSMCICMLNYVFSRREYSSSSFSFRDGRYLRYWDMHLSTTGLHMRKPLKEIRFWLKWLSVEWFILLGIGLHRLVEIE